MDLFPTIITKASTIQVLETGHIGSRSGSLQLVDSKNSGLFGSCFLKLFLLFEFSIICVPSFFSEQKKEWQPNLFPFIFHVLLFFKTKYSFQKL